MSVEKSNVPDIRLASMSSVVVTVEMAERWDAWVPGLENQDEPNEGSGQVGGL